GGAAGGDGGPYRVGRTRPASVAQAAQVAIGGGLGDLGQQSHVHQAVGAAIDDQVGHVLPHRPVPREGPVEQDRRAVVINQVGGPHVEVAQRPLGGLDDGGRPAVVGLQPPEPSANRGGPDRHARVIPVLGGHLNQTRRALGET